MLAPAKTSLHSGAHAPAPLLRVHTRRIGCIGSLYERHVELIEAQGDTRHVSLSALLGRGTPACLYLRHPARLHRFQPKPLLP